MLNDSSDALTFTVTVKHGGYFEGNSLWILPGSTGTNFTQTPVSSYRVLIASDRIHAFLTSTPIDQAWELITLALKSIMVAPNINVAAAGTPTPWYHRPTNDIYVIATPPVRRNFAKPNSKHAIWKTAATLLVPSQALIPDNYEEGSTAFEFVLMPKRNMATDNRLSVGGSGVSFPELFRISKSEIVSKELLFVKQNFVSSKILQIDRSKFGVFVLPPIGTLNETHARIQSFVESAANSIAATLEMELAAAGERISVDKIRSRLVVVVTSNFYDVYFISWYLLLELKEQ